MEKTTKLKVYSRKLEAENKKLLDSNRELLEALEKANEELHFQENWYDAKLIIETAINNAKKKRDVIYQDFRH